MKQRSDDLARQLLKVVQDDAVESDDLASSSWATRGLSSVEWARAGSLESDTACDPANERRRAFRIGHPIRDASASGPGREGPRDRPAILQLIVRARFGRARDKDELGARFDAWGASAHTGWDFAGRAGANLV